MGSKKTLRILERLLLVGSIALLAVYAGALVHRSISSRAALRDFGTARAAVEKASDAAPVELRQDDSAVNFGLWSEKRVRGYRESFAVLKDAPLLGAAKRGL